jgi:hypothetical protein
MVLRKKDEWLSAWYFLACKVHVLADLGRFPAGRQEHGHALGAWVRVGGLRARGCMVVAAAVVVVVVVVVGVVVVGGGGSDGGAFTCV